MHKQWAGGYFQAELGFRREKQDSAAYLYHHPNGLLRWGMTPGFELRLSFTAKTVTEDKERVTGLQPIEIGFKAGIAKENGALPQVAFMAHAGIPALSSKAFRPENIFPKLRMLFHNTLSEKLELGYNIGAEWDGESPQPQWVYTFAPQIALGPKAFLTGEVYGFLKKGEHPEHYADLELGVLASRDVQWDITAGIGLSPAASPYFIETGISFRLK